MISRAELSEIGYIGKPHGVAGEMNIIIPCDVDLAELSCIVLDIDGIFVPFFPESIRKRGADSYLVSVEGISTEVDAAGLTGKTVYALERDIPDSEEDDDGFYAEDLIGYHATSVDGSLNGEIVDVDDTTENILFVIRTSEGRSVLVPVVEEFIADVDSTASVITFALPAGILDL